MADPSYTSGYTEGFSAGLSYQQQKFAARPLSSDRKMFAVATAAIGLGSAAAFVATVTQSKYRDLFAVVTVLGILLGTTLSTMRVISGKPAPWEL